MKEQKPVAGTSKASEPADQAPAPAPAPQATDEAVLAAKEAVAKKASEKYGGAAEGDLVEATLLTPYPQVHPSGKVKWNQYDTREVKFDLWIKAMCDANPPCMSVTIAG